MRSLHGALSIVNGKHSPISNFYNIGGSHAKAGKKKDALRDHYARRGL